MQSSPPQRAWERPASRQESEYSLDLNALDLDTVSDIDLPKQNVERIFSEDIDGPSDFTQNMDMYMRGGTIPKCMKRGMKRPGTAIQEDEENEQEEADHPEGQRRESKEISENETAAEEDHQGSQFAPEPTTQEPMLDHDAPEAFSSEWHTYGSTSTPVPPVHKQFLQPTVEDCYSELSPARQASARAPRGRAFDSLGLKHKRSSVLATENSTPGRGSSPTLSPVRSPVIQRASPKQDEHGKAEDEKLASQLRQLQIKCQQLESLNQALNQTLDEEREARRQEKAAHHANTLESARREKDLIEMKDAVHRDNDEFKREFRELKDKLREQETLAANARLGDGDSAQHLRLEVKRLREQIELQKMEQKQEVRSLEQDLALIRRGRDDAEAAHKAREEELDEQENVHEAEISRLRAELQQMHVDETAAGELERHLDEANLQIKQLQQDLTDTRGNAVSYRNQLAKAKQDHEAGLKRATTDRERAIELASGFQRQLQELRQQLKDELTAHEAEVERLRSQQEKCAGTADQELEVVSAELEAKQTELNEAILERDEAQDMLQSRESAEEDLKNEIADMKAVNAELDARVTEKMQRREKYWKDKLEEADRERQIMAKALLHQWGREEVGIDSPQMYAYKYLNKTGGGSPVKSPTKAQAAA